MTMANFADLQNKFDRDPELCRRFLSDPIGVLSAEGVHLSPQQAFNLQQTVSDITRRGAAASHSSVGVGIVVEIRF
jgi:hypothetical protein